MNPQMNAAMNPNANPAAVPSAAQGASAYERYPATGAYNAAYAASAGGQQAQAYAPYGQDQNAGRMQEDRGAYANYAAQQAQQRVATSADPYGQQQPQAYAQYAEDPAYAQYGPGARRSTNRTVGYHPYSRV